MPLMAEDLPPARRHRQRPCSWGVVGVAPLVVGPAEDRRRGALMWNELVLTVVPLLVIVDPLASIGLFLSLTRRSAAHPAWVALKAALFATVVLVGVAFGGARALDLLGIQLYSLRVAGGIL